MENNKKNYQPKQVEYDGNSNIKYISHTTKYTDETGEHEMLETEVYKKYYGGPHFYRVWLSDLLFHLGLISNSKQMDVLFYILDNVNSDNLFIGTIRSIAEATDTSKVTVNALTKKMIEADLMTMVQRGVYMINPTLLLKGDNYKKTRLTIEYENLDPDKERPKMPKNKADRHKKNKSENVESADIKEMPETPENIESEGKVS